MVHPGRREMANILSLYHHRRCSGQDRVKAGLREDRQSHGHRNGRRKCSPGICIRCCVWLRIDHRRPWNRYRPFSSVIRVEVLSSRSQQTVSTAMYGSGVSISTTTPNGSQINRQAPGFCPGFPSLRGQPSDDKWYSNRFRALRRDLFPLVGHSRRTRCSILLMTFHGIC